MTFNEEKRIASCLESLEKVCDELIVIDSFSTDRTISICEEMGARVIQNPFEGYIAQRAFGIDQATNDYIVQLDADEVLSAPLIEEINKLKSDWKYDVVTVNRLTNYAGKWIRHCGWYPDSRVRIFDRRHVQVIGQNPHDRIAAKPGARTLRIKKDILHFSYNNVDHHISKTNEFSLLEARSDFEKGKKATFVYHIMIKPTYRFLDMYILKLGFLDGYYGLVICFISAFGKFLRYVKLRELNNSAWK